MSDKTKDMRIQELELSLASLQRRNSILEGENANLLHRAEINELTGLYRRRAMEERVDDKLRCRRSEDGRSALVIIDLNDFKKVNDTHGHAAGDMVLAELGKLIRSRIRVNDLGGRLGGDELAIFFDGITSDQALRIMHAIRDEFVKLPLYFNEEKPENEAIHPSFAFGIAVKSAELDSFHALYVVADAAMYVHKEHEKTISRQKTGA